MKILVASVMFLFSLVSVEPTLLAFRGDRFFQMPCREPVLSLS